MTAWLCVAATISLTVYGQIVIKWQVNRRGHFPSHAGDAVHYFAGLLINPWVISVLVAAFAAALSWMAAISRLPLSQAYPFVASLSFVFVLILSNLVFGEAITIAKVIGFVLIVSGLVVASAL
jgi:multidrug transporter EmrE-like cation transporter